MLTSIRIIVGVGLVLAATAAWSDQIDALSLSSDAWLREGPSTADRRITGVSRGTAVLEMADAETLAEDLRDRWVQVYVLEGRAAGREGWIWGRLIGCCKAHEWLD
ncbi:SH3 domain-containing protein [Acuticoccus sp. M5D2P5]|uniref:SH3 domain-containing protein n=1 Tax=Acuticoccus kalidii TaxID=2910977 RepID=UPI001F413D56|nr:SH3 domain-containing protein [Acuticoccus kalidii]MCF3933179.1 SH3 domain-containing protein [Acuticoccus kalidii]